MTTLRNRLKDTLTVGLSIELCAEPWIAKTYADAGADFVFLEGEHVGFNADKLRDFILTCRLCELPVVSKCAYGDRGHITILLDSGVTAIQLPMTETAEQVAEVVEYVKLPPQGRRAAAPGFGNSSYEPPNNFPDWIAANNNETVVIAHIESAKGLANAEEIAAVEGVDVVFIGPFDLSIAIGHPGEFTHPEYIEACDRIIQAALQHGKAPGVYASNYQTALPWIDKGVRFIESGSEMGFIISGARQTLAAFPGRSQPASQGQLGHL